MTLKPFNPDLAVGENTNASRAERAEEILKAYKRRLGESGKPDESTIQDMLTDTLHWMHSEQMGECRWCPLLNLVRSAHDRFVEETNGE